MGSDPPSAKPRIPRKAIVRPEDEHPLERELHPEQVPAKDEKEYEAMTTAENDLDSDDNPDFDPAV